MAFLRIHRVRERLGANVIRVGIERRPDRPPLWSWKGLGEPVVVVLLTAMVAFTVLVVGFYIAGYR